VFVDVFTGTLITEDSAAEKLRSDSHFLYRSAVVIRKTVHGSHMLRIPSGTKIKFFVYPL
jgi:hypothetical protein